MAVYIDVNTIGKKISEYPNAFVRQAPLPLDRSSLFNTFDAASAYARTDGTAYYGQILVVSKPEGGVMQYIIGKGSDGQSVLLPYDREKWDTMFSTMSGVTSDWNSAYSTLSETSGRWNNASTEIESTSANNRSVYTSVNSTSGEWDSVYTSVESTSGKWNNASTEIESTSANNRSVYSSVSSTSGDWDSVYSSVNTASGNWDSAKSRVDSIYEKIPEETWEDDNYIADKQFVIEKIQTETANFRGNWLTWTDVPTTSANYPPDVYGSRIPTKNDYLVVQDASDAEPYTADVNSGIIGKELAVAVDGFDVGHIITTEDVETLKDAGINKVTLKRSGSWRFKFNGEWVEGEDGKNKWQAEYRINETPFTKNQWSAINSGINESLVADISTNKSNISNISAASGGWNSVFTSVNNTSGDWNSVYSSVGSASGDWNNATTEIESTSANNRSVYTSVNSTSGNWNSVYTSVHSSSAEWDVAEQNAKEYADTVATSALSTATTSSDEYTNIQHAELSYLAAMNLLDITTNNVAIANNLRLIQENDYRITDEINQKILVNDDKRKAESESYTDTIVLSSATKLGEYINNEISKVSSAQASENVKIYARIAEKVSNDVVGEADGIAQLDSSGVVPLEQTNERFKDCLKHIGEWDASSGDAPSKNPNKGNFWTVSTSGRYLSVDYYLNDWIVCAKEGSTPTWEKLNSGGNVINVQGKVGEVVIIDDSKGSGSNDFTWSANKLNTEFSSVLKTVKLNNTALTTSSNSVNIPAALDSQIGVVKSSAENGIKSESGVLKISAATTSDIDARTSIKPITPSNLDYAIKSGLISNLSTLTEDEQEDIRNWLGVSQVSFVDFES